MASYAPIFDSNGNIVGNTAPRDANNQLPTQYVPLLPQPVAQQRDVVYAPYTPSNPNAVVSSGVSPGQLASGVTKLMNPSGSGILSGINNWGAANLGTAPVAPSASFIGPMPQGTSSLVGGTTAGGLIGGAGIGYAVGSVNPFVKKPVGGQIGGAVGGVAGMAAGGPIGAVIGSFIGSTLGGMIGKSPPKPGASFEAILDKDYNYTSPSLLSKHMGTEGPQAVSNEMSPYLKNLQTLGVKVPEDTSVGTYFEQNGNGVLFYRNKEDRTGKDVITNKINYNPNDPADKARAYKELSTQLARQGGANEDQLQAIQGFVPQGTQPSQGIGVAAPQVAVKDLNPNMPNNDWAGFMKTFNQRNA